MGTLWRVDSQQAQGLARMPRLPDKNDPEAIWTYLETGINRLMLEPSCGIDTQSLIGLYTAVHNYCTSQHAVGFPSESGGTSSNHRGAHLLGEELYTRLIDWLREYLGELKERSKSYSDEALIQFYVEELAHYTKAAKYIHLIFRYLHRHWVKHEKDEGKTNIHDTFDLHLIEWRDELKEVSRDVRESVLRLEKQHEAEAADRNRVKAIVDSFASLGLEDSDLLKPTLDYEIEAAQFLAENLDVDSMEDIPCLEEELPLELCLHPDINTKPQPTHANNNAITVLRLATSDEAIIEVDRQVAECSTIIKQTLESIGDEAVGEEIIPLPNVTEAVLRKVLEWCKYHKDDPAVIDYDDDSDARKKPTHIGDWDREFMQVDQEMLFEIILAANYLEIKPLLDIGCATIANMIKGRSMDEVARTFNITNDFTPEEEEQIRRENEWAEDR